MFAQLQQINQKPAVFSVYNSDALWTDSHRAKQMLAFHLNQDIDVSSRNHAFIDRSATWLAEYFQLNADKSVCDFGCGPGLYTSRLAQTGAQITGLDFSLNSLNYANAQAQQAQQSIQYLHVNYLEFEPEQQFDLITMIMCDFCALSPDQRQGLLAKFAQCLKDDGAIVLDLYSMAAYAEREEACLYEKNQLHHFWCEADYYAFVNTFKYDDDAVILDKYTVFPEQGQSEIVYNWLQYFSPESLAQELAAANLQIDKLYGDVAGGEYQAQHSEFAVVIRKAK